MEQAVQTTMARRAPMMRLQLTTAPRTLRYGKQCANCKRFFVTEVFDDRICGWCKEIVEGHGMLAALLPQSDYA
jgi:hypothetical protein